MGVHESTVNFQNLIRDLAEMYPFQVPEVVIVELVANALDASASRISVSYDPSTRILVVGDDGTGMSASQFDEYHDFAAGLKTRGEGIGFAGVGAKISFNVAERVITETRSDSFIGGSDWRLKSKKQLVWEDMRPSRVRAHGTRVEVHFKTTTSPPFATTDDIIQLLRRHYLPLFDTKFLDLYERLGQYPCDLRFRVNGRTVQPGIVAEQLGLSRTREFTPSRRRKKIGYGLFGVASCEYPLGPDSAGVLLCTHGKVVKSELFNQFPGALGPTIFGVVEVPGFISFLTTAKTDFMRTRGKHRQLESLYGPVREEFKIWLAELGVQSVEATDIDEAGKLERELRKLVEAIPELGEFFGFRSAARVLQKSADGTVGAAAHEGQESTLPIGAGAGGGDAGPPDIGDDPGTALMEDRQAGSVKAKPISRTARRGPKVGFAAAPDRTEVGWVDGNCVYINSAHPAYTKSQSNSRTKRIHCLYAIGTAIQRFLATGDGDYDHMFIDRLMAGWGAG